MPKINPTRILYEDDHLLAVNKLSRELVVRGKGEMQKLPLLDFLRDMYGSNLKPLHRLDYETSGVVLFAKTKVAFDEAIEKGKFFDESAGVKKVYVAIVAGYMKVKAGVITKPLPSRTDKEPIPAITRYKVIQTFKEASLIEAEIVSGKHHQIRKHFASIGHALAADDEYGDRKFNRRFAQSLHYKYFFLHSRAVYFTHFITGKKMHIEAPLPRAFLDVLERLRARS